MAARSIRNLPPRSVHAESAADNRHSACQTKMESNPQVNQIIENQYIFSITCLIREAASNILCLGSDGVKSSCSRGLDFNFPFKFCHSRSGTMIEDMLE
jgi:hypothetical protein